MPVKFGFQVTPEKNPSVDAIDWILKHDRSAKVTLAMLNGKIDAEVRAWINLLFTKLRKSWRKNITHWTGWRLPDLDLDFSGGVSRRLLTTPYFFDAPIPMPSTPDNAVMQLITNPPNRTPGPGVDQWSSYPDSRLLWSQLIQTIENLGTEDAWSDHVDPASNLGPYDSGFCQVPPVIIE
jgi:hypothetical protein